MKGPAAPRGNLSPRSPGKRPPLPSHPIAPSACGAAHKIYNCLETRKPTTYLVGKRRAAPSLPRAAGRALLLLHLPGPPFSRSRLWASETSSLRADDPPGARIGHRSLAVPRASAGPGPIQPPCAAAVRPLWPSPRAPGLALGGVFARPAQPRAR